MERREEMKREVSLEEGLDSKPSTAGRRFGDERLDDSSLVIFQGHVSSWSIPWTVMRRMRKMKCWREVWMMRTLQHRKKPLWWGDRGWGGEGWDDNGEGWGENGEGGEGWEWWGSKIVDIAIFSPPLPFPPPLPPFFPPLSLSAIWWWYPSDTFQP